MYCDAWFLWFSIYIQKWLSITIFKSSKWLNGNQSFKLSSLQLLSYNHNNFWLIFLQPFSECMKNETPTHRGHLSRLMTKPTKWHVRPAKTQISLGIRPVWSESSLSAWRKPGSLATHWAHSEDSDQTGRISRLIWVFAGRTVILLLLSWGDSFTGWILDTLLALVLSYDEVYCNNGLISKTNGVFVRYIIVFFFFFFFFLQNLRILSFLC